MDYELKISGLCVSVEGKKILNGVDLTVKKGEVHALMGPNGSGKSTLACALMGHPKYLVDGGEVLFKGQNLLTLSPDAKARLGLFLAFQYPTPITGVSLANFVRLSLNAIRKAKDGGQKSISIPEFRKLMKEKLGFLKMDASMATRYLNDGLSGGEKKRSEVLQMSVLKPEIAVLDEIDSGLDIDAVRIVAEGVNRLIGPDLGLLLITHYQRILNFIKPQFVHVMYGGRIVESGGPELSQLLEAEGYDWLKAKYDAGQKAD